MSHIMSNKISKLTILCLFLLSSCTTTMIDRTAKYDKNMVLSNISAIDSSFSELESLLYVDIKNQNMYLLRKGNILKGFKISSSYYGTGSEVNSLKTPLGKHEIFKKIGRDLPINAILKGRVWNGAIANVITEDVDTDFDHVTSRILWLDGLEKGKNKGPGVDSRSRYIYIHGTAEEGLIGRPASDGCIRMYNTDVIDLFDLVNEKVQVWIYWYISFKINKGLLWKKYLLLYH